MILSINIINAAFLLSCNLKGALLEDKAILLRGPLLFEFIKSPWLCKESALCIAISFHLNVLLEQQQDGRND
jgi:hypothetical protein